MIYAQENRFFLHYLCLLENHKEEQIFYLTDDEGSKFYKKSRR